LVLALCFSVLLLQTKPYEEDDDDKLQTIATVSTVSTLLIGFALKVDRKAQGEEGEFDTALLDIILIGLFVGVLLSAVYMVLKSFPCCDRGHGDDGKRSKGGDGDKGSQGGDDDKGSKGSDKTRKLKMKVAEEEKTEIVAVVKTTASSPDDEAKVITIRRNSEMARQATVGQIKQREKKADARVQKRLQLRQIAKQKNVLKKCKAFAALADKSVHQIVDAMTYQKVSPGTALCQEGEVASCMYVLMSGSCTVTKMSQQMGTLAALDVFGESALFGQDTRRTATVTADSEFVKVLVLSRQSLMGLIEGGDVDQKCVESIRRLSVIRSDSNRERSIAVGAVQKVGGKETKSKIKMKQDSSSSKDCQEVREKKLVPKVEKPIGSSGSASVVRPLPKIKQLTKKKEVAPTAVRKGALPTVTKKVSKTGSGGHGRGKASSGTALFIRNSDGASVVRPLPKVKQLATKEIAPKAVRKGALPTVTKKVSKTRSGGNGRGKASSEKAKQNGNANPVVTPVIKSTVAKPAVEKL
jgi:hypothetical protein